MSPQQVIKYFDLDKIEVRMTIAKVIAMIGCTWWLSGEKAELYGRVKHTEDTQVAMKTDIDSLKAAKVQHDIKIALLSQLGTFQIHK